MVLATVQSECARAGVRDAKAMSRHDRFGAQKREGSKLVAHASARAVRLLEGTAIRGRGGTTRPFERLPAFFVDRGEEFCFVDEARCQTARKQRVHRREAAKKSSDSRPLADHMSGAKYDNPAGQDADRGDNRLFELRGGGVIEVKTKTADDAHEGGLMAAGKIEAEFQSVTLALAEGPIRDED